MDTLLTRILVGIIGLVGYTALTVWMVVSISKPADPTDAIGLPLMMLGLCLMCTFPAAMVVSHWWSGLQEANPQHPKP